MSFRTKALGIVVAAGIVSSGYYYNNRSIRNLSEVHPDLQKVAHCALKKSPVYFVVVDGLRTEAEHKANVEKGVSWAKRSRHQDGMAIDVAASIKGKITYQSDPYYAIAGAFYQCSDSLKIPIISGGEWRVKDLMHIELDRRFYP